MARRQRSRQTGWFHALNRGADRQPVFRTQSDAAAFLGILGDAATDTGSEIHAYCLLGNHYHLLLHCPTGGLSALMRQLGGIYTQRFNTHHNRDGPLFRGRFFSTPIDDDQYLDTVGWYIHRNALAMVGSRPIESYQWSSLRYHLGLDSPPSWLRSDILCEGSGRSAEEYLSFVNHDARGQPSTSLISWAVDLAIEESCEQPGAGSPRRAMLTVLSQRMGGSLPDNFPTVLPERTDRAGRLAATRAHERLRTDPHFAAVTQRAIELAWGPTHGGQVKFVPAQT